MNKSHEMKAGANVIIFHDPFTRNKPEGLAMLVRCVDPDPEQQRWVVKFTGDGGREVERWIVPNSREGMCPNCDKRKKTGTDFEESCLPGAKYFCDECRAAARMVWGSAQEARTGVQKETNVDVLYMAAKLEQSHGNARGTVLGMLRARLGKLLGCRGFELPKP